MAGRFNQSIAGFHIVDCRFDYEYDGGHIRNAIHIAEPHEAISRFFRKTPVEGELPTCLIFHCEFSKNRAPKMWVGRVFVFPHFVFGGGCSELGLG